MWTPTIVAAAGLVLLWADPVQADRLISLEQRVMTVEQQLRDLRMLRPIERAQSDEFLKRQVDELRLRVQFVADEVRRLQIQIDEMKRQRGE